jgi:hypothetical protein
MYMTSVRLYINISIYEMCGYIFTNKIYIEIIYFSCSAGIDHRASQAGRERGKARETFRHLKEAASGGS